MWARLPGGGGAVEDWRGGGASARLDGMVDVASTLETILRPGTDRAQQRPRPKELQKFN